MKRIGRFYVASAVVEETPEMFAEMLSLLKLIPVRVEHLWHRNAFEYVAISERFREVPNAEMIPEYNIKIEVDDLGHLRCVTVEEKK